MNETMNVSVHGLIFTVNYITLDTYSLCEQEEFRPLVLANCVTEKEGQLIIQGWLLTANPDFNVSMLG
jgi:hypothetical protein